MSTGILLFGAYVLPVVVVTAHTMGLATVMWRRGIHHFGGPLGWALFRVRLALFWPLILPVAAAHWCRKRLSTSGGIR